ncbi:hypothetical protein [Fodinibius sp. Rm-B-1B1-1]|uniref:hypothetical protein n=1 Tax=Fodinibius alkaliphilus TaxID=3140241 RepID=UPI00315997CD
MLKISISIIILMHGLIHLMGFVKAFNLAEIEALTLPISKTAGLFWLLTCLLMLGTASAYWTKLDWWPIIGIVAIVLSQVLIFMSWQDAKFGTIANVIILTVILWKYFS